MAVAEFQIDQGASTGTPGRSRHDLVPGTVITLVATAPLGAGITYSWEILDKIGATAVLTAPTGLSVNIGSSGGQIVAPCAFRIKLTVNDNGVITSIVRIATVITPNAGLAIPLFAETAPTTNTLGANDPDLSDDNAVYVNRAGLGVSDQNWRGWAEWGYTISVVVDQMKGGAIAVGGDLSGTVGAAQVVGLLNHPFFGTPSDGQAIVYDGVAHRWYFGSVSSDPTLGNDLSGTASTAVVIGIEDIPIVGSPDPTKTQFLGTVATGDPPAVTSWGYFSIWTTSGFQNVLYVDPSRGNNATAARGDISKPYSTVAAAMAAMQEGDWLQLSPGVHVVNGSALSPPGGVTNFGIMGYSRGDIFSSFLGSTEVASTQLLCNGIDLLSLPNTVAGCFLSNITMRVIGAGKHGIVADASAGTGVSMENGLILSNVKIEAEIPFTLTDLNTIEMYNCHFLSTGGSTPALFQTVSICFLNQVFMACDLTVGYNQSDANKPVGGRNSVQMSGTQILGQLTLTGQPVVEGDASCLVNKIVGSSLTALSSQAVAIIWPGQVGGSGSDGKIDFGASGGSQIPDSNLSVFNFSNARLWGAGTQNITFAMPTSPSSSIIVDFRGAILEGDKSGTPRVLTAGAGCTVDIQGATIRYYDFNLVESGGGRFSNVATMVSFGGQIDDLDLNNPFGQPASDMVRLQPSGALDFTGMKGGYPGARKIIVNAGSFTVTLKDQNTSSGATNRFALGADVPLPAGYTLELVYDGTTSRWRLDQVPLNAASGIATVGTSNSIGTQALRSAPVDHVHAHGAQTDGTLHAAVTNSAAGFVPVVTTDGFVATSTGSALSWKAPIQQVPLANAGTTTALSDAVSRVDCDDNGGVCHITAHASPAKDACWLVVKRAHSDGTFATNGIDFAPNGGQKINGANTTLTLPGSTAAAAGMWLICWHANTSEWTVVG